MCSSDLPLTKNGILVIGDSYAVSDMFCADLDVPLSEQVQVQVWELKVLVEDSASMPAYFFFWENALYKTGDLENINGLPDTLANCTFLYPDHIPIGEQGVFSTFADIPSTPQLGLLSQFLPGTGRDGEPLTLDMFPFLDGGEEVLAFLDADNRLQQILGRDLGFIYDPTGTTHVTLGISITTEIGRAHV